jgi:hypothetical protein
MSIAAGQIGCEFGEEYKPKGIKSTTARILQPMREIAA